MALGLLILTDGSHRPVDAAKAKRYWDILHDVAEDVTEQEADKAMHIADIKLPPSFRPETGYKSHDGLDKTPKQWDVRPLMNDENSPPEYMLVHEPSGKDKAAGND